MDCSGKDLSYEWARNWLEKVGYETDTLFNTFGDVSLTNKQNDKQILRRVPKREMGFSCVYEVQMDLNMWFDDCICFIYVFFHLYFDSMLFSSILVTFTTHF